MPLIYNTEGKTLIPTVQLKKIASAVALFVDVPQKAEVGVAFVSSDRSQELNKRYSGHDYPTDVLSFEYQSTAENPTIGDIAICESIAKSQAVEHGITLEGELALLLVHGTLHLLGHDHQDRAQIASLDKLQSDIMESLDYKYRNFKWSH